MKSVTKLVLGAAMVAASVGSAYAANATIPLPSTNNSDLLFFVSDTTTHSTYTVQLSQTTNGAGGYFTTADATAPGAQAGVINTINGKSDFSYSFSGDTTLSSLISSANTAGDDLTYGVIGISYTGASASLRQAAGKVLFVGSSSNTTTPLTVSQSQIINGSLTAYTNDVKTLNTTALDSFNGTGSGVIGTPASQGGVGLFSAYSTGLKMDGASIGTSYGLYAFTGNGAGSGTAIAYNLGTLSFDGTTLSFVGNTPSVPLPAAAWLLGSGLLGLLGIGRRRDGAAAVAA